MKKIPFQLRAFVIILFNIIVKISYSQNVGINATGASPSAAAILDLNTGNSGSMGFLPEQVSLAATNTAGPIALPPTGLLVYNKATAGVSPYNVVPGYYYNAGTSVVPNWVLLLIEDNSGQSRKTGGACTTYQYGTCAGNLNLGANNTGFGDLALFDVSYYGTDNTAYGFQALNSNNDGQFNTGVGSNTQYSNINGSRNTSLGYKSLYYNTEPDNTAVGFEALTNNTTGYGNTANGAYALSANTIGGFNLADGTSALQSNVTGGYNTAVGYNALYNNYNGYQNLGIGYMALYNNTTGVQNSAVGFQALVDNTTGTWNTANGNLSLFSNIYGSSNVANGYGALYYNTNGSNNTGTGYYAMFDNLSGSNNVADGYQAMYNNDGNENTAIGAQTMGSNISGNENTALGYGAGPGLSYLQNTTLIGYDATTNISNVMVLGNTSISYVGTYAYFANLSDARFKKNVAEDVHGLDFIMKLRPITYNLDVRKLNAFLGTDKLKDDNKLSPTEKAKKDSADEAGIEHKESIKTSGFLAQEVEQAAKEANYDFDGVIKPANDKDHYSLSYEEFTVPIVKAIQEQQHIIDEQAKQIAELKKQVESLLQSKSVNTNK